MVVVDGVVIDEAVANASFCCDLRRCKGACCCIEGGRGAPLEDAEVLEIEKAYPIVKPCLSAQSIRAIESSGLVDGMPGNFAANCIDQRECVFAYFDDDGIARCAFEKAFLEGLSSWRKPVSCHLFPIRVRREGADSLRYEFFLECGPGRERGEAESVGLVTFLKAALERKYGETWYATAVRELERWQRKL